MTLRPLLTLVLSLLTLLPVSAITPLLAAALPAGTPAAENTISLAFDLDHHSLNATARISLPPGTPLTLAGGSLTISSAVLERAGQTPMSLRPSSDNAIVLAPSEVPQTLYLSWTLTVPEAGENDNLISSTGVTLAGHWHPMPDIDMRYRLEAHLPPGFTGISEGEANMSPPDSKGRRRFSSRFALPVQGIHFVAGPYEVQERSMASGVILATYFFPEDRSLARDYLDQAASYLRRYEELIGAFPYPRYSIVENRLPTGYGMPTFTLLGQAVVRLPFIKETSLGHEILHSWFGNSVEIRDDSGNWCEGLTTYLSDHLYAEDKGEGGRHRKEQLQRYASFVPVDNTLTLADFHNASDSQPMARQVRAVGYDKGSMLFHMLRQRLGDEKFHQGLRSFYENMRFRQAGWDDIEESFTAAAGEDLSYFFDQWLARTDLVKFIIDTVDVSQEEGRSVITFTVQQKSVETYEFDLPVLVSTLNGQSRQNVRVAKRTQEVKITTDDLPQSMALDPDYDLMRVLRPEEEAPTWSSLMGPGRKTVVLPQADVAANYEPLLAIFKEMGAETVAADKLETKALRDGDYIFLGASPQSLALFADPRHAAHGFTLDVRKNPLAQTRVMALITSSSPEESAAVAKKLSHYGKYSFLAFAGGQIKEKRIAPTVEGLRIELFQGPMGVRVPDIRTFDQIIGELQHNRVVYVGEVHTDMGAHILQLQIIQALFQADPKLAIGLEMFPRAAQNALDGYINGEIATEREFLKQSKYFEVWGFDYRLYREIIGFARRNHIPLVGLNIDKTVVDKVFKDGGPDGLDAAQLKQVPSQRNLDLPGYRERLIQAFVGHERQGFDRDKLPGFLQSQALWDEAMAETIAVYLHDHPDHRMVVVAGNGHVYRDTGIPPRVARRLDVSQGVVSSISYGSTGLETGSQMDYLLYTRAIELSPAPKVGVVLDVEGGEKDPAQGRVRVRQISPHSKAGEAGLKEKDLIVAVETLAVHDINDIKIALLDKKPGDKALLKVRREHDLLPDEDLELTVELTAPTDLGAMGAMPLTHPK